MSWEVATVVVASLAAAVSSFAFLLRYRRGEQSATVLELARRLDRLEGEVRNRATPAVSPMMMPNRMGAR